MMMRIAVNFAGLKNNSLVPQSESEEIGEVCISNISPAERRKRLLAGVIGIVIALVILVVLIASGADRLWRLPLFLLFWGAANGYFQWRDKT
ncbi:MAG: hypothetical protein JETCAE01_26410 [Anaerolineaceae bacterium]|nr:MAG: hypothetical protein JETCAE01_26410 [Anaerolineaceae bacterium]